MASVPVSIATAAAALVAALAAVTGRLTAPPPAQGHCVSAVSVFYANERTSGSPSSVDTVLWVPGKGSLRDSLVKSDSAIGCAAGISCQIPDMDSLSIARPIQVCVDSLTPLRVELGL